MKSLVLLSCALAFCLDARAATASAESVERLLAVTKIEALLVSSSANVEQSMRQGIAQARAGRPASAEEQQSIDVAVTRVAALLRDEMTWSKLKPEYVRLYVETFDQAEVDGLLAFYATPTGQLMIDKMPVVLQKAMAIGQAQMQALMPRLTAIVKESLAATSPR